MRYTFPLAAALSLALAACSGEPDPAGDTAAPPAGTGAEPGGAGHAGIPAAAADGAAAYRDTPGDGISDDVDEARFDGVGPAFFGMDADEVRDAWPGELEGGPENEGAACYHLSPVGQPSIAHFALMFGDGRFVRYSVDHGGMAAPGGGRVGMGEAEIEQRYGPGIERSPHKYVEGGEYLRIDDPAGGEGVLIFETDAGDVVTEWRAGVLPQVRYVEGCA